MAALMLGLDFCKTDLLISLWNEDRTCAEIYNISGTKGDEFIPSMVIYDKEGRLLAGKEAVEYSLKEKESGITALYAQPPSEVVELNGIRKTVEELFGAYLDSIFFRIRKRFGGALIARIGITGERLTAQERTWLTSVFESIGYSADKLYFSSHADAFLWYEFYDVQAGDTNLGTKNAMALDFDSKGMQSYHLTASNEEKGIPYYLETVNFSELMPGGLSGIRQEEEQAQCFSTMTELALNRREVSRLYVTGAYAETAQATQVLQGFSRADRRIFSGRSLYALGACYHAVKERITKAVICDGQVFHRVSLLAYEDAKNEWIPMIKAGTLLTEATKRTQVILDDTLNLQIKIEDVRNSESLSCTFEPEGIRLRENKTIRLELTLSFLDYDTLIIKLRDIGFGSIYPATFRVWEQVVSLGKK